MYLKIREYKQVLPRLCRINHEDAFGLLTSIVDYTSILIQYKEIDIRLIILCASSEVGPSKLYILTLFDIIGKDFIFLCLEIHTEHGVWDKICHFRFPHAH